MPQHIITGVDNTALMALGFLGAVLLLTIGLFAWLMVNLTRRRRTNGS